MAFTEIRSSISIFIPGPHDVMRMVRKWMKRAQKRREIAVLLKQEDWVLNDMGITRGDVRQALAAKHDPSLRLRALAARRRFWARQSARL